jgi:DeoR/GlpR family transcriptional regulator of sugar metabolism
MAGTGEYTIADLAEVFTVSRATVYRTLQRAASPPAAS